MKDIPMLVWITQLGMTVAAPLAGFTLVGVWLQRRFETGKWVILVFCLIGLISAVSGLKSTLKYFDRMTGNRKQDRPVPGYNSHE